MSAARVEASIVVPTFERKETLLRSLEALRRQDYPRDRWEVLVVDDGSRDGTLEAVQGWLATADFTLRCLRQENRGAAAARNRGAAEAGGEHLLFIDNDIRVAPDFVSRHLRMLRSYPGSWVVGRITNLPAIRETPFGRYRDDLNEEFQPGLSHGGPRETVALTAANLSLPASDFRRLGGFDERFTIASCEDWDLGLRARQAGIRLLFVPEIVVEHDDWAVNLERFCERQRLYSNSDVRLWRKYGALSPRARLVNDNAPPRWGEDGPALVLKKLAKGILAASPLRMGIHGLARILERAAPDSALSRRLYRLAVSVAIFRGIREGFASQPTADAAARSR